MRAGHCTRTRPKPLTAAATPASAVAVPGAAVAAPRVTIASAAANAAAPTAAATASAVPAPAPQPQRQHPSVNSRGQQFQRPQPRRNASSSSARKPQPQRQQTPASTAARQQTQRPQPRPQRQQFQRPRRQPPAPTAAARSQRLQPRPRQRRQRPLRRAAHGFTFRWSHTVAQGASVVRPDPSQPQGDNLGASGLVRSRLSEHHWGYGWHVGRRPGDFHRLPPAPRQSHIFQHWDYLYDRSQFTVRSLPRELRVILRSGQSMSFQVEEDMTSGYRWIAHYDHRRCSVVIAQSNYSPF